MLSGLISTEGIMSVDFMKDMKVVTVISAMCQMYTNREKKEGIQVGGPREAGGGTAHTGMWLRLA